MQQTDRQTRQTEEQECSLYLNRPTVKQKYNSAESRNTDTGTQTNRHTEKQIGLHRQTRNIPSIIITPL